MVCKMAGIWASLPTIGPSTGGEGGAILMETDRSDICCARLLRKSGGRRADVRKPTTHPLIQGLTLFHYSDTCKTTFGYEIILDGRLSREVCSNYRYQHGCREQASYPDAVTPQVIVTVRGTV